MKKQKPCPICNRPFYKGGRVIRLGACSSRIKPTSGSLCGCWETFPCGLMALERSSEYQDTRSSFFNRLNQLLGVSQPFLLGLLSGVLLLALVLCSGCSTPPHVDVDLKDGVILVCVDTLKKDQCYKAEPKPASPNGVGASE